LALLATGPVAGVSFIRSSSKGKESDAPPPPAGSAAAA